MKQKKLHQEKSQNIVRYNPDIKTGLTDEIVLQRKKDKLTNKTRKKNSKSYFRIICENTFTYFNLIWAIIIAAYIYVNSYNNLLFVVVIFLNTFIAIIQECRAKRTVDKLSLITAPKVDVVRNGQTIKLNSQNLVLDDIVILTVGNQIPADSILVGGEVEVNESLLTGESNPIKKLDGDELLAGSFIVSGTCYARVNKTGDESYIQSIASEAKKFKSPNSNLFRDLNNIIKYIGIGIIPVAIILYINNFATSGDFATAIVKTCGALTGMIPAGMFLLVTVALAVGVVKLSQKKTLIQDLYSIEMLARTNMLCLDKTGTITDGTMTVTDIEHLEEIPEFKKIFQSYLHEQSATNATQQALINYFGNTLEYPSTAKIDFSSDRKYSATSFEGFGTFLLGAPEFVCKNLSEDIKEKIIHLNNDSKRVLLLARTEQAIGVDDDNLNQTTKPISIISIEDHIRDDAIETINWFKENGVQVKIISGDNPNTVSAIAKRVGVEDSDKCISLEGMSLQDVSKIADQFTIFGRVSPEQKHRLVKTLKNKGYVVAMTGDGVNDTLALKESDCSIAMADGSDVARSISNVVLMDSKFSSLPKVVNEGRQVINNIQKSSTLFLMKTLFTILFSLFVIVLHTTYPFESVNLLLMEIFVIGLPSFILALEPNSKKIEGEFITTVLKNAIPSGLLILFNVGLVMVLEKVGLIDSLEMETLSILVLTVTGFLNLVRLCFPFTLLRVLTVIFSAVCIVLALLVMPEFFGMFMFNGTVFLVLGIVVAYSIPILLLYPFFQKLIMKLFTKKEKNEQN
ncbi:MAG: HAD-IC family P-type ATPase [Clostridia bacterium]|nr:HAD-IC family P-type ATPase [Clostridia bacterium]